jgi:hypothetical protein
LKKSVEYAINPPLVVITNNNMQVKSKKKGLTPSFKEIAQFKMSDMQKETMKALIEDDNKIEKLRGAKMSIIMDDDKVEAKPSSAKQFKFKQNEILKSNKLRSNKKSFRPYYNQNKFVGPGIHNGPIDISNFKLNSDYSFLETNIKTSTKDSKYTKPISVIMKLPSDPDPKIKNEIGSMEKKREDFESKLFKKAKEEFKLITALTKKELQLQLNHELLPFFVVSKNGLKGINDIISASLPSQTKNGRARFLELDGSEIKKKFPHFNSIDPVALNRNVYSGILNFFLGENKENNFLKEKQKKFHNNLRNQNIESSDRQDLLKSKVDFDYEKCLELAKNFKNLDCDAKQDDYNKINDYLHSSFIEMKAAGDDLINVKFAASDEPYPTIEKLIAQMMTRRDLAEKFERLKILEYESHLQKAENEMIQDILHENIFRIMAFYGPSIEGMREHIR